MDEGERNVEERDNDCKKFGQEMHFEKMMDSINMLSKQAPDMMIFAENGQSVLCHKYGQIWFYFFISYFFKVFDWMAQQQSH